MPLYGDILQANFFDLKNSINRQINDDLEPLKGFGINFFGSYHPLVYLYISWLWLNKGETTRNPQKTLFKFLAGVSKIIAAFAAATSFRVLYWWRQQCKQISNGRLEIFKKIITLLTVASFYLLFSIWFWMHLVCLILHGVYSTSDCWQHVAYSKARITVCGSPV
jgi:hypothetical protein